MDARAAATCGEGERSEEDGASGVGREFTAADGGEEGCAVELVASAAAEAVGGCAEDGRATAAAMDWKEAAALEMLTGTVDN
jgi:hypothetical protein